MAPAKQWAQKMEMPFEEGVACLELGKALGHQDPEGKSHLQQAQTIFARLGTRHELTETERLLASTQND